MCSNVAVIEMKASRWYHNKIHKNTRKYMRIHENLNYQKKSMYSDVFE
jgi:hypothetical protein